jgi:hypothetical protein
MADECLSQFSWLIGSRSEWTIGKQCRQHRSHTHVIHFNFAVISTLNGYLDRLSKNQNKFSYLLGSRNKFTDVGTFNSYLDSLSKIQNKFPSLRRSRNDNISALNSSEQNFLVETKNPRQVPFWFNDRALAWLQETKWTSTVKVRLRSAHRKPIWNPLMAVSSLSHMHQQWSRTLISWSTARLAPWKW